VSDLRAWIHGRLPAGENLTREQLIELATAIGHERRFWIDKVRHDPQSRFYAQLYRDANIDVWLICWMDSQDTGYHDHDISSGAVYVVEGLLHEDYLYRGADGWVRELTRERRAGTGFHFDGASIHGMRHAGGPPATSIHVYSPALWRMGWYEPGEGGLRRAAVTYADELIADERAGVA
jgi:Cysteine dioxygenase type I